jgi:hypothetical protein
VEGVVGMDGMVVIMDTYDMLLWGAIFGHFDGSTRNDSFVSTCGVFSGQKSTSSSLYVIFKRFSMGDTRSSGKDKSEDDIKEVGLARIFCGAP